MTYTRIQCSLYAFAGLTALAIPAAMPAHAQITKSGVELEIYDYLKMPVTGSPYNARINFMREEPAGANRLFVNDLNGPLYVLDKQTKNLTTYINFANSAQFPNFTNAGGWANGHVTFQFHPEFATNGKMYTVHIEGGSATGATPSIDPPSGSVQRRAVLTEFIASDPSSNVFSGTSREIMRVGFNTPIHPMGDLGFNPTAQPRDPDYGLLYVAIGDGGAGAHNTASLRGFPQALNSVVGKILRIDPDISNTAVGPLSANGQYRIPNLNPYTNDGNSNTLGEIYASGFRNPHRITWDPTNGVLYSNDIGQHHREEVNIINMGGNYGWASREGTLTYPGLSPVTTADGFIYPVAEYDHSEGDAITNGIVYRGTRIPELYRKYIYGDITTGRLFYSDLAELVAAHDGNPNTKATIHEIQLIYNGQYTEMAEIAMAEYGGALPSGRVDIRLAMDGDGELYVLTKSDGMIRVLIPEPSSLSLLALAGLGLMRRRRV